MVKSKHKDNKVNIAVVRIRTILLYYVTMENDDDARKSLLAGNRRSQAGDPSARTYYDMQQPSSTAVSDFRSLQNSDIGSGSVRLADLQRPEIY